MSRRAARSALAVVLASLSKGGDLRRGVPVESNRQLVEPGAEGH